MNIVERLKNSLEYEYNLSFSERKQLLEEIDRLNNIIDGLEEYCWELKAMGCREGALDMLDKLKALKENK